MILQLLVFIVGLIYGYVKPGKEDRMALLKKGAIYGIILGIVFGIIRVFLVPQWYRFFYGGERLFAVTAIGTFISVVILVIIFIIGTFIGDLVEGALKK